MTNVLDGIVASFSLENISETRKEELNAIVQYIIEKKKRGRTPRLNFICTHNSRRSQFSQLWASVMAKYFNHSCETYSGGIEITACYQTVISTLVNQGFNVSKQGALTNPVYQISRQGIEYGTYFSKRFDDPSCPSKAFAAVMTCDHADQNCPLISGAEQRLSLRYSDPKIYDNTKNEQEKYRMKSLEIAQEMYYIFSSIPLQ